MSSLVLMLVLLAGPSFCNEELETRLANFRNAVSKNNLHGYIIPNSDYHASETPMERDKIREWLTGFTGSNGDAAFTLTDAALWTDSRYTIQANKQVSKSWSLPDKHIKMSKWLAEKLETGQSVGADAKRMPFRLWLDIEEKLNVRGIKLVGADDFLEQWKDRPSYPNSPIFIHDIKYNGVLTSMNEIAWLLNLRGGDVLYTPVFAAFMIIKPDDAILYVRSAIVNNNVKSHLQSNKSPVRIKEYNDFWIDWKNIGESEEQVFIPNSANYFVFSAIPTERRKNGSSLIIDLRAYKTATEVNASREAHINDGIAHARLFKFLEKQVAEDHQLLNESFVAELSNKVRNETSPKEYIGPSFSAIVASGINGALPHYQWELGKDAVINNTAVMYIDSGGQYMGGTTDTTRALHFGQPRPIEIKVYTSLLKGVAKLGGAVFPEGYRSFALDTLLREPLYQTGFDYGHGSTHGIGVFLSVHEDYNGTYYENFIGSQEPGYYEENNFGMRLENAVVVVQAKTEFEGKTEKKFLKFSPLTLVPYERKLIDPSLMDESELKWVNDYHKEVLNQIGKKLLAIEDKETYDWLLAKTLPIKKDCSKDQ